MGDIILALAVLAIFALVFFAMKKLGTFIYKNQKIVEWENECKNSDEVVVSSKLSDEEILEKVHKFQKNDE